MPKTDIELIREAIEVSNRGDVEGLIAFAAEDAEVFIQEDLPNGGYWRGKQGFRDMVVSWNEAWDEFTVEPLGFEEAARGLLVPVRQHAKTGELELDADFFYVFELADGQIVRWHLYNDEARAREAAGLER